MEPLLSKRSVYCLHTCLKNRNHFKELHDRATAATTLASSLGYDFNLAQVIGEYLVVVVDSVEKELAPIQLSGVSVPGQIAEPLDDISLLVGEEENETEVGYSDEYEF